MHCIKYFLLRCEHIRELWSGRIWPLVDILFVLRDLGVRGFDFA